MKCVEEGALAVVMEHVEDMVQLIEEVKTTLVDKAAVKEL